MKLVSRIKGWFADRDQSQRTRQMAERKHREIVERNARLERHRQMMARRGPPL